MPDNVPWLAPGVALFRAPATPDEPPGWRLRTADGGMLAVGLPAEAEPDAGVFADDVALGGFGPSEQSPLSGCTVGLQATEPFARPLLAALAGRGAPTVAVADQGGDAGPVNTSIDVLVSVSGSPAPEHWLDLEVRLPTELPWFRVAVEGRLAQLEPPRIGPRPVTHRAVRARRLATAPRPVELAAYWSGPWWSGPTTVSPAGTHLLTELLVRDLEWWAAGVGGSTPDPQQPALSPPQPPAPPPPAESMPPPDRRLRVLDLHELRWTDHPILPVPDDTDWRDGR